MSQNRIRGPVLTLVVAAALGGGIWLVNEGQRSEPPAPQPVAAQAPAPSTTSVPAPPIPAPPAFPASATYAGEIPTKTGVIAVDISIDGEQGVAYACDGAAVDVWLRGSASDGKLNLVSADGESRLTGRLEGDAVAGTLAVGAKSWTFTAARSVDDGN